MHEDLFDPLFDLILSPIRVLLTQPCCLQLASLPVQRKRSAQLLLAAGFNQGLSILWADLICHELNLVERGRHHNY